MTKKEHGSPTSVEDAIITPDKEDAPSDVHLDLPPTPADPTPPPHHRLRKWLAGHKKTTAGIGLLLVVIILAAIPVTRFGIAGLFLKQTFQVTVLDEQTKQPVSSASVQLANARVQTDNRGKATLKVKPGKATLDVTKKYYKTSQAKVLVPILKQKQAYQVLVRATGRQVPISVINKVTGKALAAATIKAGGSEAKTDKDGRAILVLPAQQKTATAELSAANYNSTKADVHVTTQTVKENTFALTPAGTIYFLSNLNGKIDVVKSNLDGTNRQIVVPGTGFERADDTSLLASRDWKYLAFKAVRDNTGLSKLYVISTSDDKLTTADEGDATFNLVGWYDHTFVYSVFRNKITDFQTGRTALKSYNAASGKLATLDQTQAEGAAGDWAQQSFTSFYIVPGQVVYGVNWDYYPASRVAGKNASIRSVGVDGQGKKDHKTFELPGISYLASKLYEPGGVYFAAHPTTGATAFYEFEDNAVKSAPAATTDESFNRDYPTFLLSPSGERTFWSETRDGKNTLFEGDKNGNDGKQFATLSEYQPYGWYSDDYIFVSKGGSELYIMPKGGGTPTKVTDYYRPPVTYRGYGYGYGGF